MWTECERRPFGFGWLETPAELAQLAPDRNGRAANTVALLDYFAIPFGAPVARVSVSVLATY